MVRFSKGEAFPLPPHPQEGVVFSVEKYTMLLIYYFNRPNEQEKETFKNGDFRFAMTSLRGNLFVLSRFGLMSWMDTPYSTHLSATEKSFPKLSEGQGYAIDAFLVDCSDNTLAEHRLIHLDTKASRALERLILQDAAKTDFSAQQYDQSVKEVYQAYTPKDLVKLADFKTLVRSAEEA